MLRRTISKITIFIFFLVILFFPVDVPRRRMKSLGDTYGQKIVISGNQTWNGDFIVELGDTVVINNSDFTVRDGRIQIYGTLVILNSTIHMFSKSYWKFIELEGNYGNLTIVDSKILGKVIICVSDSCFLSIFNSTVNQIEADVYSGGAINIEYSNFSQLWGPFWSFEEPETEPAPKISVVHSKGELIRLNKGVVDISITESDIQTFVLFSYKDSFDLELQPGYVEQKSIIGPTMKLNVTILDSYIHKWIVFLYDSIVRLSNSTIEHIWLIVRSSINLTLNSGFFNYKHIVCDSDLTVINSTINSWEISARGGELKILDSSNISVTLHDDAQVYIDNSIIDYIVVRDYLFPGFWGNLNINNSTVNLFAMILRWNDLMTVANLTEGYQTNIIEINVWKATLNEATINHISIVTLSSLELYNCTLSGYTYKTLWTTYYGIMAFGNISINNCTIADMLSEGIAVNITNSKVDLFHAYGGTITAVNSTINTLINDPPPIELINSTIAFEVEVPFPLTTYSAEYSESLLQVSILDEADIPLPEEVKPLTKFLSINILYNDIFEVRIKIYYNESKLNEMGIDENSLRIYELKHSVNTWEIPPKQGINPLENYVWANVTCPSSYFVIGTLSEVSHVDVTLESIILSNPNPKAGETLTISVEVKNLGDTPATFNLILNYTRLVDPMIGNQSIGLGPNQTLIVNYTWTPDTLGRYKLLAYITNLVNDINPENNKKEIIIYVTSNESSLHEFNRMRPHRFMFDRI